MSSGEVCSALTPTVDHLHGLSAIGKADLLAQHAAAILSSTRCPATLVLEAYDFARALRDAGIPVISGFHSTMEKECLDLLLRGTQPVIVCSARSPKGMRIPAAWRQAIDAERMLLVSQFPDQVRRVTAATALQRNQLVADLAKAILVIHAAPNSQTLSLCERGLAAGKPVFALDSPHNEGLARIGAQMISPNDVSALKQALGG